MNKYVFRTSLVWIAVLAVIAAGILYRRSERHVRSNNRALQSGVAPIAAGPAAVSAPNAAAGARQVAQPALAPIQLTPQRMQSIGVTTGSTAFRQVDNDIRATGNVDIDQRLVSYVQVRFPGYIRRVFANAPYQYVRKGEPLFTIYSPDLVAAQQDYLLARGEEKKLSASTVSGVGTGAAMLATAAWKRLQQWEVPQRELNQLKASGKPITNLTFDSPVTGYVTQLSVLPNMFVEPTTRLYTVADLSRVWIYAQVFQDDVGQLKPGDHARITVDAYPSQIFAGRIDQILPQVDLSTRTVRVRLAVENRGLRLKPGMFVNVEIKAPLGRALVVPASAVLQSGSRQLVFLYQGNGRIEPRQVTLGAGTADGGFVVLSGLKANERIVTSANFLIDSESQLQSAVGAFAPPPPGAGQAAEMQAQSATVAFTTDPNPPRKGNNNFMVKLIGKDGRPIDGADVTARFFVPAMPAMGMGAMSVTSTFSDAGGGAYLAKGSLGSGGAWQVTITARKRGQTIASKQFSMSVMGGM